jgi:hypothetical protein
MSDDLVTLRQSEIDEMVSEAARKERVALVSHILHECDSADSFGDDIETEDVRFWLTEYHKKGELL